ncbi:MAG: hypothetical protein LC803_00770 [Acidobacteria bacterium]|nr:hypothetical protein [Acidobacteriota bacterium]
MKLGNALVKFNLASCLIVVGIMIAGLALTGFAQAGKAEQEPPVFPRIAYDERAWKEFESTDGGFIVAFPGKPGFKVHTVQTRAGALANHTHGLDIGVAFFAASYADTPLPVPAGDKELINRALDAARDNALSGTGGQLISEEPINLDGYIGRSFFYSSPNGSLTHNRSYVVGNRLYQLLIISDDYRKAPAEDRKFFKGLTDRFFASFKLTRKAY